jgi:hypothetical protein
MTLGTTHIVLSCTPPLTQAQAPHMQRSVVMAIAKRGVAYVGCICQRTLMHRASTTHIMIIRPLSLTHVQAPPQRMQLLNG